VMCVCAWGGRADQSWMVACMCARGGYCMCVRAVDHVSESPLSLPKLFSILLYLPSFVIPLFFSSKTPLTHSPPSILLPSLSRTLPAALISLSPLSLHPLLLPPILSPPLSSSFSSPPTGLTIRTRLLS
jgi:hypothetical protein